MRSALALLVAGTACGRNTGLVTLAPSFGFADLVSWADRAIAVWTTPAGEPQLTRLCPPVEAFAGRSERASETSPTPNRR